MDPDVFVVPDSHCVGCGRALNRVGRADSDAPQQPRPGDFTACIRCGMPMVFTQTMDVRAMTALEWAELPDDARRNLERIKRFAEWVSQPHERAQRN